MDTEHSNPTGRNHFSTGACKRSCAGGFTLVEIMVATVIFTITSLALASSFIQNEKFTRAISYRTQATTISMGMVEQIRWVAYSQIPAAVAAGNIPVVVMDPANINTDSGTPAGYRPISLLINSFTSTVATSSSNATWTTTTIPVDTDLAAPKMPIRWWLTINQNTTTGSGACDAYEITLIYQWQIPGNTANPWQSGTIRLLNPNDATT
jgi:prepilin-type N-terminal cleavage/methylation domain-containing protein